MKYKIGDLVAFKPYPHTQSQIYQGFIAGVKRGFFINEYLVDTHPNNPNCWLVKAKHLIYMADKNARIAMIKNNLDEVKKDPKSKQELIDWLNKSTTH